MIPAVTHELLDEVVPVKLLLPSDDVREYLRSSSDAPAFVEKQQKRKKERKKKKKRREERERERDRKREREKKREKRMIKLMNTNNALFFSHFSLYHLFFISSSSFLSLPCFFFFLFFI